MNQLLALQQLEFFRIKNWFRYQLASKLIVMFVFLLIVVMLTVIEYFLAYSFFRFTWLQKEFGIAVAEYSTNAVLLVLFLLSTASSFTSSSQALYKPDVLRFLHSLPISQGKIYVSRLLSPLLSSAALVIFFLTPLLVAFQLSFNRGWQFYFHDLIALLLLVVSSQMLGTILAVIFTNIFGKINRKITAGVFVLAVSGSLILMRFLFPPAFFRLYYATDWQSFEAQLGKLPLLSTYLPTNWLASTITHGLSVATFIALGVTLGLVGLSLLLGETYYLGSWRKTKEGWFLAGSNLPQSKRISNFPAFSHSPFTGLVTNDVLAVSRSGNELGYLAFLFSLVVILLFLLRNIPLLSQVYPEFLPVVLCMSMAGFSYLFMTLAARLVYPLLAREKHTAWLLFSLPLYRQTILKSKATFAMLVAFPALAVGLLTGLLAEFSPFLLLTYALVLLATATTISLIQFLIGTIAPNFMEADNLEAASTSGSGLAAILLALIFTALVSFFFYQFLLGRFSVYWLWMLIGLSMVIFLLPLWLFAKRNINNYDL